MEADLEGETTPRQQAIVDCALTLMLGVATVGNFARVDEATGYHEFRARQALATILEEFITKERRPWTRTFPFEFYQLLYKLRGWHGPDGRDTNDIVHERLAPGIPAELQRINPTLPAGGRHDKHHHWFAPEHEPMGDPPSLNLGRGEKPAGGNEARVGRVHQGRQARALHKQAEYRTASCRRRNAEATLAMGRRPYSPR
ncbi:MAG: P63C domain-containing protein [Rhodospirillales bacterium]|nr:P63C domain-containing protein [Rhodospirillales bacterium]